MGKKTWRMASLDTSSTQSGYALWENGRLVRYGSYNLKAVRDKEERIHQMCSLLWLFLMENKPDIVVVEMTVVETNAGTQRLLSEIVGVVRAYTIFRKGTEFVRLRPSEWRKLVTEDGEKFPRKRAELKEWSVRRVKECFDITVDDDTADAILIGLARINQFH